MWRTDYSLVVESRLLVYCYMKDIYIFYFISNTHFEDDVNEAEVMFGTTLELP